MSIVDIFGSEEKQRIVGVVVGIVTNNKDPSGMARVKVKFPWREESDESYWARIATLMTGKEMGSYFLPEVGDEVLVSFDHGDIHHPYVVGCLWNGQDKPPVINTDGKNDVRKIKSRSGHEIIFNDGTSQGKIEVKTKAGHRILLDDSSGSEKIEINDSKGNSISIDSAQSSMKLSSKMNLSIESQIIEINAGAILTLKGGVIKIN